MKKIILSLLFVVLCFNTSCSKAVNTMKPAEITPEQTIKNYFSARNSKNEVALNKTISKKLRQSNWQLSNLDFIKLIYLEELDSGKWIRNFPEKVSGEYRSYSIKIFKVDYEVKYKIVDTSEDPTEGRDFRFFILVRENSNSPWLIDSIGL